MAEEEKTKNEEETKIDFTIEGLFPTPVYVTQRDSGLDSTEQKEIEEIIKKGEVHQDDIEGRGSVGTDQYILNTKFKKIKEFCEQHIKVYVEKIISPEEENELNFYITQSWLTYAKPGEGYRRHLHSNSIISGVYYILTVEDDGIYFHNTTQSNHNTIYIETANQNPFNSNKLLFPVDNNKLILFPSWLDHSVEPNGYAITDRISLAFNVFVRGMLGKKGAPSELIL